MAGKNEDLKFSIALDDDAFRQQLTNEKGQLTRFGREAKRLFKQVGDDRALQLGKELKLLNDVEIKQKKYLSTLRQTIGAGGRGGAGGGFGGKAQMGVSSVAYAVEDFFASTGSLSNRLRGVSNNVSQLGMALGGVQGLIAGVAIGALGQFAAKMFEATDATTDGAAIADAMTAAEKRLASAREVLAEKMKKLTDDLATAGFSDERKRAAVFTAEAEEFADAATKTLRAALLAGDPVAAAATAKAAELRKERDSSSNPAFRAMLERQAVEQDEIATARVDKGMKANSPIPGWFELGEELDQMIAELNEQRAEAMRSGRYGANPPPLSPMHAALVNASEEMHGFFKPGAGMAPAEIFEGFARTLEQAAIDTLGDKPSVEPGSMEERLLALSATAANHKALRGAFEEHGTGLAVAEILPGLREAAAQLAEFQKATANAPANRKMEADMVATSIGASLRTIFSDVKDGSMEIEAAKGELQERVDRLRTLTPQWEASIKNEADARKKAADEAKKAADAEQKRLDGLAGVFKAKSPMFQEDRDRQKVRDLLEGAREAGVANPLEGVIQVLAAEFAGAADGVSKFSVAAKKGTMVLQDTSTGAGAAEYARLLSGDDSARSAELTEARGTNKRLDALIDLARDEAAI